MSTSKAFSPFRSHRRYASLQYALIGLGTITSVLSSGACTSESTPSPDSAAAGAGGTVTSTMGGGSSAVCSTDCDDGFSCTLDTCVAGACKHSIGPNEAATACPNGQYCTIEKGCVNAPACATNADCTDTWKGDACRANARCDAASSVCVFDLLDKDGDEHAPYVCGGDDCNDRASGVHPGADEICNGIDDNCDGTVDEGGVASPLCGDLMACNAGVCECKAANTCPGACVDLQTDLKNCGACGNSCVKDAVCAKGLCVCDPALCGEVLWTGAKASPPNVVALDATHVYWATGDSYQPGSGSLHRAKKDGTEQILLAQGTNTVTGLALDSNNVYFTVFGTYTAGSGAWATDGYLARIPKVGGTFAHLYEGNALAPFLVGERAFFIDALGLYALSLSGGQVEQVVGAVNSTPIATSDGTSLFYRDFDIAGGACTFYAKPVAGGEARAIRFEGPAASSPGHCAAQFAVDERQLYWSDDVMKQTRAMLKSGGETSIIETYSGSPGLGLAVDDSHVYYSVSSGTCNGSIRKATKSGDAVSVLASSQCRPGFLALDDTHVYWVSSGDYAVRRVAK